jgi:hypothetical protein
MPAIARARAIPANRPRRTTLKRWGGQHVGQIGLQSSHLGDRSFLLLVHDERANRPGETQRIALRPYHQSDADQQDQGQARLRHDQTAVEASPRAPGRRPCLSFFEDPAPAHVRRSPGRDHAEEQKP